MDTLTFIKDNVPEALSSIKIIFDNNTKKWNTKLMGIPVVNPIDNLLIDIELIAITCGEGDVIEEQLREIGLPSTVKVVIPDIYTIDREGRDYNFIWSHIDELEAVYNMLSDDKSKMVFSNILNFKVSHDTRLIEKIHEPFECQYFDERLIQYKDSDVFLDCGSYIGDTIEYYKRWSHNRFGQVYAVEGDEDNFKILKENYIYDNRIKPLNVGLRDIQGELKFNNIGSGSGRISDEGLEIKVTIIDDIIRGDKLDFIKMDIEGAEYKALIGGRNTIEEQQPVMMISVYHKQDDFIRIPLLIRSLCPSYHLYFRYCRKMSVQETVCYAIV